MQFFGETKAATRLARKSLCRLSHRPRGHLPIGTRFVPETARRVFESPFRRLSGRLSFFAIPGIFVILFCVCGILSCTPARDTVMRDVERNYTGTGFLDTDTFQIRCLLETEGDRLGSCKKKLVVELVAFKENYDRTAYARRNHADFQPFLKPIEVSDEKRAEWGSFYEELARDRARLVHEMRSAGNEVFEGIYRLRQKDLIHRVQNVR